MTTLYRVLFSCIHQCETLGELDHVFNSFGGLQGGEGISQEEICSLYNSLSDYGYFIAKNKCLHN